MNGGNPELSVELRLLLSNIRGDAARAGAIIKKALSGEDVTKQSGALPKQIRLFDAWGKARIRSGLDAAKAMKWYEDAVRRATIAEQKLGITKPKSAQENALEEWRKEHAGGVAPGMKVVGEGFSETLNKAEVAVDKFTEVLTNNGGTLATAAPDLDEESRRIAKEKKAQEDDRIADAMATSRERIKKKRERDDLKKEQDTLKFRKDLSLLSLPLLKPTSVFGTAFASRAVAQGLLGTLEGRRAMRSFGLKGAGGATVATAALVGAATALGLAFKALSAAVNGAMAAYEKQARIYAKSLSSGLSIGFVQRRTILANIMGVSEEEVIRFGKAMEYLSPKIAGASQTLARTTIPLTQVQWEFGVLKLKFEALFASLAEKAAPSILKFVDSIEVLVDMVSSNLNAIVKTVDFAKWLQPLYLYHRYTQAVANKVFGVTQKQIDDGRKSVMPTPQSYMKQLGASSLERMGLVMGMGTSPMIETSKNTKRTADVLIKIHDLLKPHNIGGINPLQSYR